MNKPVLAINKGEKMNKPKRNMQWKQWCMILSMMAVPCLALRAADPAPQLKWLVGYWKLNEGSGTTVYDSSGNQAHGEIVGNANWESGESGPILSFDGETTMVKIPDGGWNNEDPLTLMCWWKPESMPEGQKFKGWVFNHRFEGRVPGNYMLAATGSFAGYGRVNSDEQPIDESKIPEVKISMSPLADEWNFATIVFDTNELKCYLDGQLVEKAEIEGWPKAAGFLSLGARYLGAKNDNYFKGQIREMAIFNRALTAEEIAAIHAAYLKGQSLSAPAAGPKIQPARH
jgi:hypothetical protein